MPWIYNWFSQVSKTGNLTPSRPRRCAVLTSYGVTAVSSVDTGGRGPGNDKKIGRPKPAIQPPKAGRQSDRFVKTWLEPLSGREEGGKGRWGGNLDGWNLKSIFFPVQTGKQANWQTGRVIDYEETWGSNKRWKPVLMVLYSLNS